MSTAYRIPERVYIKRSQDDRLQCINRTLTRIESFALVVPVTKMGRDLYMLQLLIYCKQAPDGLLWQPTVSLYWGRGWHITGAIHIPGYAMRPIRTAILAQIRNFRGSVEGL